MKLLSYLLIFCLITSSTFGFGNRGAYTTCHDHLNMELGTRTHVLQEEHALHAVTCDKHSCCSGKDTKTDKDKKPCKGKCGDDCHCMCTLKLVLKSYELKRLTFIDEPHISCRVFTYCPTYSFDYFFVLPDPPKFA